MEAEIFPLFSDLPSSRRIVQRHQMQFAHSGSLPGFAVLGTLHRSVTPGVYPSGQRGQAVNLLAYAFGGSNPPAPITKPLYWNYVMPLRGGWRSLPGLQIWAYSTFRYVS